MISLERIKTKNSPALLACLSGQITEGKWKGSRETCTGGAAGFHDGSLGSVKPSELEKAWGPSV